MGVDYTALAEAVKDRDKAVASVVRYQAKVAEAEARIAAIFNGTVEDETTAADDSEDDLTYIPSNGGIVAHTAIVNV